jgi:hypothetical protein
VVVILSTGLESKRLLTPPSFEATYMYTEGGFLLHPCLPWVPSEIKVIQSLGIMSTLLKAFLLLLLHDRCHFRAEIEMSQCRALHHHFCKPTFSVISELIVSQI